MPKNGLKAVEAKEPNDLYDSLNETGREVWDLIGGLGFRPDKDESGQWVALSISGDDKHGPCESLSALAAVVQNAANNNDDLIVLEKDHEGNPYLPGAEEVVDRLLAEAAGKYHSIKLERTALSAKETDARNELAELVHAKKSLFKVDPDNTDSKIYKAGGIIIRVKNEWSEKITTEESKVKVTKPEKKAA